MSLTAGQRLGPYEIVAPIGAGGMGEVFKARDTRLGRDVAIKISAEQFSERFEREARAIAALNHPNICTLHDVGPNYLVMELVAGDTLAERIDGLAVADALSIARQMADALEAAHEKGIVHRDLKPANVKITPDGVVKVLDFGLAKTVDTGQASVTATSSPTLLSSGRTELGLILGTAAYMSPEQAKGRSADKRADIWAFGVVLYEMLTGRRLFSGETASETIASVIKDELPLDHLPPSLSPAIRRLLARCLERDPKLRLRDIGEARIVLASPGGAEAVEIDPRRHALSVGRGMLLGVSALALVVATATAAWFLKPAADAPLRRLELGSHLAEVAHFALAPDGSRIAYFSNAHLYVRALDSLEPQDLGAVHVTAAQPFWSPDGRTIGFTAAGAIKTIPAGGGQALEVCSIPATGRALDLAWRTDGTILFAVFRESLYHVPATGGTPAIYLTIDPKQEIDFHSVAPLPDNRVIVTTHLREGDDAHRTELLGSRPEPQRTVILSDPSAVDVHFDSEGYLLFARQGANRGLWAVPFDGAPVDLAKAAPIVPGGGAFSSARDGTAVVRVPAASTESELVWVDRKGAVARVPGAAFGSVPWPVLSPDGSRAALIAGVEGDRYVLVRDLESGADTPLTLQRDTAGGARGAVGGLRPTTARQPSWSPNGDEVLFSSGVVEARNIVSIRTDGSGTQRSLVGGLLAQMTPDRRHLVFIVDERGINRLRYAPLLSDGSVGPAQRLTKDSDPTVDYFHISPDGALLAYTVREADGRMNVFLTEFPGGTRRWQVTTQGGAWPHFSRDGKELVYVGPARTKSDPPKGAMFVTPIALKPALSLGVAVQLFEADGPLAAVDFSTFDVARDGRLLTTRRIGEGKPTSARLVLVENWRAALAHR